MGEDASIGCIANLFFLFSFFPFSISDFFNELNKVSSARPSSSFFRLSFLFFFLICVLVACYATLQPALSVRSSVGPSVCRSVRPLVRHTLLFWGFCGLWPHCSCPNDEATSNMAPAHLHATRVAVYLALFYRYSDVIVT